VHVGVAGAAIFSPIFGAAITCGFTVLSRMSTVCADGRNSKRLYERQNRGEEAMKVKKTITDKVLAANRENAQKSTGPKNTDAVKRNACTHGLLSKNLFFQSEEEKREFGEMLKQLQADQNASGLLERILVEEAASSVWKLRMTEDWDFKELLKRRGTAKAVLKAVAAKQ
jgi:hypothetical protein